MAEWDLPPDGSQDRISLNRHELLLLDYTLCPLPRWLPDDQADVWKDFRLSVWAGLDTWSNRPNTISDTSTNHALAITKAEATVLLYLLPTTHRWGTGDDCGFSLKLKLSQFLRGVYHDNQVGSSNPSESPAPAETSPGPIS